MIIVAVGCAALAALLLVAPDSSRRLTAPRPTVAPRAVRGRRRWRWPLAWAAGLATIWTTGVLSGMPAAALASAGLIVALTCARLAELSVTEKRAARARADVVHACSVLASQVRVGRVPAEALREAAQDCPVLTLACTAQELGGDVTRVWQASSSLPGHAGLSDLARAWQVSAQTGAPLAHNLEQASTALTSDLALRAVVAGELSASRATGKIMAVLPFCGLGMGYLIGGDPLHFLWTSPYGWGCLVLGSALAAAGVLWIDKLARLAGDQG